ncbi:MAG TPA: DUF2203 domain-containing protein [Candidatus Kapabacteria bacterium]|nr:DUF2203 domain-containing protein [Candidatus Kapabacteria bacterium]
MRHNKHFTLNEARHELTAIIPVLNELIRLKQKLDEKGFDVYRHQYFGGMGPNGQKVFPAELEQLVAIAQELDARGIELKGLDDGLIDFPHIRTNGEEVYLCYQAGEQDIMFWHTIEGGYAARQPLPTL